MNDLELGESTMAAIERETDIDLNKRLVAIAGILHGLTIDVAEHLLTEVLRNVKSCAAFDATGHEFTRAVKEINERFGLSEKLN